jgi:hypothetical protein
MAGWERSKEITMMSVGLHDSPDAVPRRSFVRVTIAACALLATVCALSTNARDATAKSEITAFSSVPTNTQAGSHPTIVTSARLGNRTNQLSVPPCDCNDPRDVVVHAPAGVVANPHVLSRCKTAEFATFKCPAEAQVGLTVIDSLFGHIVMPLYRAEEQASQAALFGFVLPFGVAIPQYIEVNARTGSDYGLDIKTIGLSHLLPVNGFSNVFWGVPGQQSHNFLRWPKVASAFQTFFICSINPVPFLAEDKLPSGCAPSFSPVSSSLPVAPFTQNPTTCAGSLVSILEVVAYDRETDFAEAPWPATTGCDQLSFDPSLAANPTTTQADTAAGVQVDLRVPQFQDPNIPSPSEIRATKVVLPGGFSLSPNAADGKTSCSDTQAAFGTEEAAQCPEFSKVGTSMLDSSALPAPIHGYIYLGDPRPGDRYRVILTANGFGTNVKVDGSVRPDVATGRLTVLFDDLPQAPFQQFKLHFFGSERGTLATPVKCGTYPVESTFVPWASELSVQTSTQFFVIDSGPGGGPCPGSLRPFQPSLEAGVADNTAATHSPFTLRISRPDGDQNLSGLTVKTPPGFSASLKGIPYCPEAAIDRLAASTYSGILEQRSPACPAASQVGTTITGAGAGTRPLYLDGKAYLAGPYKGAPLSLLLVVPAVSGPYDLGAVAVRAAVYVDPITAQVTTVSDPLPQILEGVLLRLRTIQVSLDRPGFALNPTNCDPFSVDAAILGDEGASSSPGVHFQVANCADLPYSPKLALKLSGGVRRRGHPAIHAVLLTKPGEANSRRVSITLPKGELLDNAHIGTVCTRLDFAKDACPGSAAVGRVEATSPLLERPLRGSVYLRSSSHDLPDLVLDLEGQFEVEAAARVDSVNGRFRATFETIPDVPVSRVVVDLAGGSKGLLQNTESLCGAEKKATVRMRGQNRKTLSRGVRVQAACGSGKRAKRPSIDSKVAR